MSIEHTMRVAGARVRVVDGKVDVLTDPLVERCPVRQRLYGSIRETRETVKRSVERNIQDYGMYTPDRRFDIEEMVVSFGASEIAADATRDGLVDGAIMVCDGAGTVLVRDPITMEAIGAHMTGLESTSSIPEVVHALNVRGAKVLDRQGTMDPMAGLEMAAGAGMKKVILTLTGPDARLAPELRCKADELDLKLALFSVHNTEITARDARVLAANADIIWPCASRTMLENVSEANLQVGTGVPVIAMTAWGRALALNRLAHMPDPLLVARSPLPSIDPARTPSLRGGH